MISDKIAEIPDDVSVVPPQGDDTFNMFSLVVVIPVPYKHGLQIGKRSLWQLEQMEDCHPMMSLWNNTIT
eukprot:14834916-Ditylum_brightwellii.AAC.1